MRWKQGAAGRHQHVVIEAHVVEFTDRCSGSRGRSGRLRCAAHGLLLRLLLRWRSLRLREDRIVVQ